MRRRLTFRPCQGISRIICQQSSVLVLCLTLAAAFLLCIACPASASRRWPSTNTRPTPPSSWHVMQDGVVFFNGNQQGGPRGGNELAVQNWWMGMAERPAGPAVCVQPDAEPRAGHAWRRWLSRDLPGRRNTRRPAAHRSPASARLPHAGGGRLGTPLGRGYTLTLAGAARRRARARPRRLHAPLLGFRESHRAARPSHLRLDAHRDGFLTAGFGSKWRPKDRSSMAASPTNSAGI